MQKRLESSEIVSLSELNTLLQNSYIHTPYLLADKPITLNVIKTLTFSVVFLANAAYAVAQPHFSHVDFTGPSPVVEWNQKEMPGELEVLDHLQRGAVHYVGVELSPSDRGEMNQAYVLVCDTTGQVVRSLPLDEHFGGWKFVDLGGATPRQAIVVSGGGGAHIYLYSAIYALGQDGVPADLLFEARGAWVEIEDSKEGLRVIRSFDKMGGGHSSAKNVYGWDGQRFVFDTKQSTWREEPPNMTMVWERDGR